MRVATEKESKMHGLVMFPYQRNDDTFDHRFKTRIEMISPDFLHKDRHAVNKEMSRAFKIGAKEKLTLSARDMSLENRSHHTLFDKMLDIVSLRLYCARCSRLSLSDKKRLL